MQQPQRFVLSLEKSSIAVKKPNLSVSAAEALRSLGTPLATSYGTLRPVQSIINFGTTHESDEVRRSLLKELVTSPTCPQYPPMWLGGQSIVLHTHETPYACILVHTIVCDHQLI